MDELYKIILKIKLKSEDYSWTESMQNSKLMK